MTFDYVSGLSTAKVQTAKQLKQHMLLNINSYKPSKITNVSLHGIHCFDAELPEQDAKGAEGTTLQRKLHDSSLSRLVKIRITLDYWAVNWLSRSFEVMDFCWNQKSIHDFLFVTNCHLSSISHRFRDIASRNQKSPHPSLRPQIEESPLNFCHQICEAKS